MSTRSSIKYSRPDDAPGYHLFDDVMDHEDDPPVYLELFGIEAEVRTSGYVHVVIPRAMARELGLLPPLACHRRTEGIMTEQQFHILAVAMLGFARNSQQTYENARAVLQQIAESGAFDTYGVPGTAKASDGGPKE